MKVLLNGKEVKCHSFTELKPGDVFGIVGDCIYIKTSAGTMMSLVNGTLSNYANQPIQEYPDAVLVLDAEEYRCRDHGHHAGDKKMS